MKIRRNGISDKIRHRHKRRGILAHHDRHRSRALAKRRTAGRGLNLKGAQPPRRPLRSDAEARNPDFPPTLGEAFPQLAQLRNRLAAKAIEFVDLPAAWARLLFNLPDDMTSWSRNDALSGRKQK